MSEWMPPEVVEVFDQFDNDYGNNLDNTNVAEVVPVDVTSHASNLNSDVFSYQDPLKYAHKYQFEPLDLNVFGNAHVVDPHYVDGYFRKDGTYVEGYYRDGDGNHNTHLTTEQGGGYLRTNPDGNPFNNLD